MSSNHVNWIRPVDPAIDRPCRGCGQVYQYRQNIGWIMLGPCDRCAEGIPGAGTWGRLEDGRARWKLNDEDPWRTLTLAQAVIKDAEERAAIEAIRRRRRQN
jgi:hypothetical protein